MLANLGEDTRRMREIKSKGFPWYVLESALFENGYQAVVLHRIAHWFRSRGIPLFGPLVARTSLFLTGVDISPEAVIGPGLRIAHGVGLVIGNKAEIGSGATLLHQVTIGARSTRRMGEMPSIGDDVFVAAGARIVGGIDVGSHVFIGMNTVVTEDVPSHSKVSSASTTTVSSQGTAEDERPRPAATSS